MRYFDKAFFKLAFGFILFILLGLFFIDKVQAQVINEILYSPSTKQWVEIYNNTGADIDLTQYKILDNGASVNGHGITAFSGGTILPPGGYGVVAKDTTSVSANPLFKASLGIKTTGDTITLKKGSIVVDTIQFIDGVALDGNSFSRQLDGSFANTTPTPGSANGLPSAPSSGGSSATTTDLGDSQSTPLTTVTLSSHYSFVPVADFALNTKYQVSAGRDRLGFVGVPLAFKAIANTLDQNAFFTWNFGDGSTSRGREVAHQYDFPGDYVVVLNSTLLDNQAVSRVTVKVVVPEVYVSDANQGQIALTNKSKYEINLYGWKLQWGREVFEFPMDTIVSAGGTIKFPVSITKLYPVNKGDVVILKRNEVFTILAPASVIATKIDPGNEKAIYEISMKLSHAEKELADMLAAGDTHRSEAPASQTAATVEAVTTPSRPWISTVKHFFGFR